MKLLLVGYCDDEDSIIDYVTANKILETVLKCWTYEQVQVCIQYIHGVPQVKQIGKQLLGNLTHLNQGTRLYLIDYIIKCVMPLYKNKTQAVYFSKLQGAKNELTVQDFLIQYVKKGLLNLKSISKAEQIELRHILFKIPISK